MTAVSFPTRVPSTPSVPTTNEVATSTPTTPASGVSSQANTDTFEAGTEPTSRTWVPAASTAPTGNSMSLHQLMFTEAGAGIENNEATADIDEFGDIAPIDDEDELFLDSLLETNDFDVEDGQNENIAPLVYAGYFLAVAAARHLATKALTRAGTALFKKYAGQMARYVVREVRDATGDAAIERIMGNYNGSVNELMKKNRSALRGTVKDMFGKPIRGNQTAGGAQRVYNHTGKTKNALDGMRRHAAALERRIRQGQADGSLSRTQINTARKQLNSMENEYTALNRKLNEISRKADDPGVFK